MNTRAIAVVALSATALVTLIAFTVLTIYARSDACTAIRHTETDVTVTHASAYFASDYQSAREKFVSAGALAEAKLEHIKHPYPGPSGGPLYTDVALLGNPQARQFLVLISGIHGVEGFAGSALQVGLLEENIQNQLPSDTAILMIHAINPYGMAFLRRFNEDNVDLNRNFRDHAEPPPLNRSYHQLAEAIAPDSMSPISEVKAWGRLAWFKMTAGKVEAKAAISGGQYTHPEGLFYGGTFACPS